MSFSIDTVINHFWVLAITVNTLNAAIFWFRAQSDIQKTPDLRPGYIRLIRGFLIGMSIPWVVMGVGMTLGGIDSIADYFYPRGGNQFVLAWWVSLWVIVLLFSQWLWFRGGAEMLVKYPAFLRSRRNNAMSGVFSNPKRLKLYWLINLMGGVVAHAFIWTLGPR